MIASTETQRMHIDKHKGFKQGAEGTKIKILRHALLSWECGGNESCETLRSGAHTGCLEQIPQETHAIVPEQLESLGKPEVFKSCC